MAFQPFSAPPGAFLVPQFAPPGSAQPFFHAIQPQASPPGGAPNQLHGGATPGNGAAGQQPIQFISAAPGLMPHLQGLPPHAQAGFHSPHPGAPPPGMTPMLVGPGGMVPLGAVPPHLRPGRMVHMPMQGRPGLVPIQILPNGQQIPLVALPPGVQIAGMPHLQGLQPFQPVTEGQHRGKGKRGAQSSPGPEGTQLAAGSQPPQTPQPLAVSAAPVPQILAQPHPHIMAQAAPQPITDLDKLRRLKADIEAGVHPIYKPLSAEEQKAERERREREAKEAEEQQRLAQSQSNGHGAQTNGTPLAQGHSNEGHSAFGPDGKPITPATHQAPKVPNPLDEEIERKIAQATKTAGPDPIDAAIGRATQRALESMGSKPGLPPGSQAHTGSLGPPAPSGLPAGSPPQPPTAVPQRSSFPSQYLPGPQSSPVGPSHANGSHGFAPPAPYRGDDRQAPPPRHEPAHWTRPESPPPPVRGPRRRSPSPSWDRAVKAPRYESEHYQGRTVSADWRHPDEVEAEPRRHEREWTREAVGREREPDRAWEAPARRRESEYYRREEYADRRPSEDFRRHNRNPSDAERYDPYRGEQRRISGPPPPSTRPRSPSPVRLHEQAYHVPPPHQESHQTRQDTRPPRSEGAKDEEEEEWTDEERRQYEEEKRRYEEEKARYYRELEEYERKKAARAAEKRARQLAAEQHRYDPAYPRPLPVDDVDGAPMDPEAPHDLDGDAIMGEGLVGGHARNSSLSHHRPLAISVIDAAEAASNAGPPTPATSSVASAARASYERPAPR